MDRSELLCVFISKNHHTALSNIDQRVDKTQCTVVFRGSVDISFSIENVYTKNPLHNTYLLKNPLHVTYLMKNPLHDTYLMKNPLHDAYLMKNPLHNISCDEKCAT